MAMAWGLAAQSNPPAFGGTPGRIPSHDPPSPGHRLSDLYAPQQLAQLYRLPSLSKSTTKLTQGCSVFKLNPGQYQLGQPVLEPSLTKSSFPKITPLFQEAFWSSKEAVAPKEICQVFQVSLAVEEVNQVLLEFKDFSVVATCIKLDTSGHTKLGP